MNLIVALLTQRNGFGASKTLRHNMMAMIRRVSTLEAGFSH